MKHWSGYSSQSCIIGVRIIGVNNYLTRILLVWLIVIKLVHYFSTSLALNSASFVLRISLKSMPCVVYVERANIFTLCAILVACLLGQNWYFCATHNHILISVKYDSKKII